MKEPDSRNTRMKQGGAMKGAVLLLLLINSLSACCTDEGRTRQMFPDCDQATAEEQRQGRCMRRPDLPEGL